ncbi:universal stress protein [Roseospirillum parvum]|uniref:Nucleotide-binding universal stress protein, UspA family n=1 Tax=Roseospirillum parvum TaxID=83401 RepID=A0A1G7WKY8_9PROT|nr:universal stress protein [Roseospirillum parvum]SDG72661.1 Nucleotide-binding universal stress protein, UspA family [Roseospirillum parvum]
MYHDILVALDLEDPSDVSHTLPAAIHQTQASGARLHAMTVLPSFGMSIVGQYFPPGYEKDLADKVMRQLKDSVRPHLPEGLDVHFAVGEGNVYEAVLTVARRTNADLIVIGAHRPELKDYLLGPNAARVVRHADTSVLVVRPDE